MLSKTRFLVFYVFLIEVRQYASDACDAQIGRVELCFLIKDNHFKNKVVLETDVLSR